MDDGEVQQSNTPEDILCNPPDAVLRHPGKHCITQLVEAKSRRSCHSISNLVIIKGYPQEEKKFFWDFPLKLFLQCELTSAAVTVVVTAAWEVVGSRWRTPVEFSLSIA